MLNMAEVCRVCGDDAPAGSRGRKPRFCSTRCRVAGHRREKRGVQIPEELLTRPRWIRHEDKRPASVDGYWIGVTDESKWATYDSAVDSSFGDGLGFVLNGDGVVCVDVDDCFVDGRLVEDARALLGLFPETYVEISPSGRGLHIWGVADLPAGRVVTWRSLKLEIYPAGRYLTVTNDRLTLDGWSSRAGLGVLSFDNILAG